MTFFKDKAILVTGCAGTVGRELVRQLSVAGPREIRGIDVNESEIFFQEIECNAPGEGAAESPPFRAFVGDVRDPDVLMHTMEGVEIVFHAAALKHVIMCERSPFDAVQTNIMGVKNTINAALAADVECVIFTSSDKAVNPTSVMGTSKLMGERLITAANSLKIRHRTIFSSTRFGNVIGSRGSVVPLFYRQIANGGPVTLTDRAMTRFVMTVEQSVRLVLEAARLARGGEVFVTKMLVMRTEDLARVMIELVAPMHDIDPASVELVITGARPGEKMYEELLNVEETRRALELETMFAVTPAFSSVYQDIEYEYEALVSREVSEAYSSDTETAMTPAEIKAYFQEHGILERIAERREL